ncbi:uncharacterized protein [Venturia canescens]|uniref:uncharacterized protein n=1 Tax=Venturia canescens TaxID=32260 RepID=UPI001C9C6CAC|nr:uncharacterized protein LOC122419316 [Venturia canescens]
MTVDLYYVPISPPARMVMMLAKALGVHLNLKPIDIFNGEHMQPEYRKINPQKTIPALDDNGFVLSESRAIMGYLVNKYAKNDSLYPKNPQTKGIVDQRLFFDTEKLYGNIFKCWFPVAFKMASTVDEKDVQAVEKSFEILNVFLENNDHVAGENLTIADFSILVSVSMAEIFGFDVARYDNVAGWYERCKEETSKYGYEEFIDASSQIGEFYRANIETSRAKPSKKVIRKSFLDGNGVTLKDLRIKMPIDLYHVPGSKPCRAVRLAAAALGVDLNLKHVDLMHGEHLKPEFLKLNPQHTIPTIDDNGFHLWESPAIMGYLVEQYGKNDSLYPKDPKQRAVVNQRLYFDMGTLYLAFSEYYYPMIFSGAPKDQAKYDKISQVFGFFDKFLEGKDYAAGNQLTIADFALITTVSNFELMEYDFSQYENVTKWASKIKAETVKYEEINGAGLQAFKALITMLSKKSVYIEPGISARYLLRRFFLRYLRIFLIYLTMSLDLYYYPASPPCRAVMLTAEAIGLTLNYKSISVMAGENHTPEYEQLNPQKTIPFLVDGDYRLNESRAIMGYLVDQYGNNERLYPASPAARALVNQRLFFDIGTLYKNIATYYFSGFFGLELKDASTIYEKMEAAFEILDTYLDNQEYVTGRNMTIADFSMIVSVTTAQAFGFDVSPYKNVEEWVERMKTSAPGYRTANGEGLEMLKKMIDSNEETE